MNIVTLNVRPTIPEALKPLEEIAYNLWLSWNFEAVQLFIRIDYDTWVESRQNPVRMLGLITPEIYEKTATDDSFIAAMKTVHRDLKRYLAYPRWRDTGTDRAIAYFSMEYGMDAGLPIYSGGLGMLAGDHLKAASDLGLPLVGVGLLYRQGYFKQYLNPDGFQQESYPENDFYHLPIRPCENEDGSPVIIGVKIGQSVVLAKLWKARVGRNDLYLMDTNLKENAPEHRVITATLYGGDRDMRIRQEILLGIGGMQALEKLGILPSVVHMNEGHSAFLALERIRLLIRRQGLSFREALEATKPTNVFTTHTPVPAGNERFDIDLMKKYFADYAAELGLSWEAFLALGRENPANKDETFCLTVLALRLSTYANGVSRLHGHVSRNMWKNIWPTLPAEEVPITHITNGVHPRSWLSHNMDDLFSRYLGPHFKEDPTDFDIWDRIDNISDEELWRAHERRRERLVIFTRERLGRQFADRGMGQADIRKAGDMLSPYALTICFARRFATYKRGTLLLRDPDRLVKLLSNNERPVQMIFAGKAHPNDHAGKEMIKALVHFARNPEVRNRIVFIEDYDMATAKHLVSGSDIWLNMPRRPQEASGTSGMKAGINGSLNVSVLDGWWDEGYDPECGWAIGQGEVYQDEHLQDEIEGKALFDLLEQEIIPLFYTRGRDGLPRDWIRRMKHSIITTAKGFTSHRMVMEYFDMFYQPSLGNSVTYTEQNFSLAKDLAAYMQRVEEHWKDVKVELTSVFEDLVLQAGDEHEVLAKVTLGQLAPEDVEVQLYHGPVSSRGDIVDPVCTPMEPTGGGKGVYSYRTVWQCGRTGRQGYTVRIEPKHRGLVNPANTGLITWA